MLDVLLTSLEHGDQGGGLFSFDDFRVAFVQFNIDFTQHQIAQVFQLFVHLFEVCQQPLAVRF